MKDYVKEYFDRHAQGWVEAAYVGDVKFPIGSERIRLAIEGVAPAIPEGGRIVDLGCGGGQLCVHAARLGWRTVGVDVAPGMIEEARAAAEGFELEWVVGEYDQSGLPDGDFHAVTALGLIEYLDDDDGLFAEASRLLHEGGRFAVSCRNRLYNLLSVNDYSAEAMDDDAKGLLDETVVEREQTRVVGPVARANRSEVDHLVGLRDVVELRLELLRRACMYARAVAHVVVHDNRETQAVSKTATNAVQ